MNRNLNERSGLGREEINISERGGLEHEEINISKRGGLEHEEINVSEKNRLKCEILAPAGSFECMKAAYQAGADAVYAGSERFGARQTVNFEKDELIEAINYSHLRGKRFYLTVNTLLKEKELENELYEYLLPAYEAGLDAAIVQDMGVLLFIRRYFPELSIHASTQMNVTGTFMAQELKSLGASRIVTARELSLGEISDIYKSTGLEIESFVHGALCYSYSGQCLLSSMIGGRSGNRGHCAQPCRLAYDVMTDGLCQNKGHSKYALSPKDLCTLELIPDILEAGVFSLKIEGRMKKPEYVAGVTAMYRKYVDLYQTKGRDNYRVDTQDIEQLKEIYNRGGFTDGYYRQHNAKKMMSLQRPNHCGVLVAAIHSLDVKTIRIKARVSLKKGDVLSFAFKSGSGYYCDYTLGKNIEAEEWISIENKFQNGFSLKKSMLESSDVFRIRNNQLIQEILENYTFAARYPLTGRAELKEGIGCLTVRFQNIQAKADTQNVSRAKNRPLSKQEIKERLMKTGETEFFFQNLEVVCEENLFVPVKELNELRRRAIETLRQKILSGYKRTALYTLSDVSISADENEDFINNVRKESSFQTNIYGTKDFTDNVQKESFFQTNIYETKGFIDSVQKESFFQTNIPHTKMKQQAFVRPTVAVLVSTYEQFLCAVSSDVTEQIYIETSLFSYEEMSKMAKAAYNNSKKLFCALPYIFRKNAANEFWEHISFYSSQVIGGFVLRNLEEYFYLRSLDKQFFNKDFIFDSSIYCYNRRTGSYLNSLHPYRVSFPRELDIGGLAALGLANGEIDVYGYVPVMFTANCLRKNFDKCNKTAADAYYLKDRKDSLLRTFQVCRFCYNVIYYPQPLSLLGEYQAVRSLHPVSVRFNFTFESREEMEHILRIFTFNRKCDSGKYKDIEVFTRGHFRKEVL